MERLKYIVNIIIIALLIGAIAISKDGRILGKSIDELGKSTQQSSDFNEKDVESTLDGGIRVINSTPLAKDVIGYAGTTPINLHIKDNIIVKVEALPNDETPSFFKRLTNNGFFDRWNGMSLAEASEAKIDAISGATYSSDAVTSNVKIAAAYAASIEPSSGFSFEWLNLKSVIGVLVILLGVFITFRKPKNKVFEIVHMLLNVAVLGFWCGSFLSLTQFIAWMSNGFNLTLTLLTILLLGVVIILPFLGKRGSYCHLHCPMGSAQELLYFAPIKKIKLGVNASKFLNRLRYYILLALLFMMWIGVGYDLINYEIFSAFLINSASNVVLIMAGVFLILSLFIKRPYCRFVCPTGALITTMQKV